MTTFSRRSALSVLAGAGAGIVSPSLLRARAYPTKPVRLIVGFAPGGLTDLLARLIAPIMAEQVGQQVIVENRPGANGNVGMAAVVNAAPDGHTLLFSSAAQIVYSPNTYKTMPADPINGLRHVSMAAEGDFIIVTNEQTGLKNLDEFLKFAKANPGKLNYGTAGAGGTHHVLFEFFKKSAGIELTPVHYRGSGPLVPDLLANQVQLFTDSLSAVDAHIKAGKMVALLVASTKKEPALPNIPTAVEVNMPALANLSNWFGLHAPKATPDAIVDKLNAAVKVAISNATILERLKVAGMVPVGDTPAQFAEKIVVANKVIGDVARSAGIQVE
jgi:tripartite-type tricarboxylate transporter receptor subunit TctC